MYAKAGWSYSDYPAGARYTVYGHQAVAMKSHQLHQENISIAAAGESEYMCPVFFGLCQ